MFLWTTLQLQISMLKNKFNCANTDNISFFFFQIFFLFYAWLGHPASTHAFDLYLTNLTSEPVMEK